MSTLILCNLRVTYSRSKFVKAAFFSSHVQSERLRNNIEKVVNVAIIGSPNSGKSTLINSIAERKICAASNKVHTTRKLARAICYSENTQIVFLDTPGVINENEKKKYNLPESMLSACHKSLRCADVVGVVHDVSNRWTRDTLSMDVVNMLKLMDNTPSFLMLNKVDKLKSKDVLLNVIRSLTNGNIAGNPMPNHHRENKKEKLEKGYSNFSDVFLISALNGEGVMDIKNYLISNARPANPQYSLAEFTDQTPETLIEEAVRAKFLDFLAQEIPYNLKVNLEYYEEDETNDKILCSVAVECPSERLMRLVGGAGGGRLQQIKSHVRNDLIDLFKKTVLVDIQLRVQKQNSTSGMQTLSRR